MSKNIPKAVLIDVIRPETPVEVAETRLEELESLVQTFGGIVIIKILQKRGTPDYETFIGKGKLEELVEQVKDRGLTRVIINNILKPRQIYAINEHLREHGAEAWDRVDLILKIFSKHAQSVEAKLQIELASIRHMGPRIFGMGIELSRQAGAIGLRAGQGETNIELMKRHLQSQELAIREKLRHFETIRAGHRRRRRRHNLKTAALVGYTNAGKSSLLNALTNKGAYTADKLFATLDTRVGRLYVPATDTENGYTPGKEYLISDTIGFIQDLPPELIEAFKSTLAETIDADLLLHVIDIADPLIHKKIKVVEEILDQLGLHDKPKIYVFNKIDKIKKERHTPHIPRPSLMKAGKDTAKKLGWTTKDEVEKARRAQKSQTISQKELKSRYEEFTPVFVSAEKRKYLPSLIQAIDYSLRI